MLAVRPKLVFVLCCLLTLWTIGSDAEARRGRNRARNNEVQKETKLFPEPEIVADKTAERDGKVFSLFNIVQFKNQGCRSTSSISSGGTGSTARNGTCFTSSECASKGGLAAGSCAAGFGVCCVFTISNSGGSVNQNCTYIRNPGFPMAYTDTSDVTYSINKCSKNVCYLRLDFESFTIQGTGNTEETDLENGGGICLDMFSASVNTNQPIPVICGQNTGQHMYLDVGNLPSDSAQLSFAFGGESSTSRMWEIKVTQLPCDCNAPPDGCLQYHTGLTGRFTTFNFLPTNDNHLQNQQYSVCIRQEAGFCCIEYTPCADADSFSLNPNAEMAAGVDTGCSLDYILIEGSGNNCASAGTINGKYCGSKLNTAAGQLLDEPICDCTAPFAIDVYTDAFSDVMGDAITPNTMQSRGTCLTWMHIPC